MTADQTPLAPEPGPDAGIDDIQADIEHTRKELGETIEALSAKADVKGRVKQKTADTKDRITEKAHESKDVVVEKAHAAQSAARDAVTDDTRSVKPGVPLIAALIAAAVVIGPVVWRRRRDPGRRERQTRGPTVPGQPGNSCGAGPTESTSRHARRPAGRYDRQSARCRSTTDPASTCTPPTQIALSSRT